MGGFVALLAAYWLENLIGKRISLLPFCIPLFHLHRCTQIVIFSVERNPRDESFTQCVHFDYSQKWMEKGYTLANLFFLYGLPLTVIITCYSTISYSMMKRSRTQMGRAVSMTLLTDTGKSNDCQTMSCVRLQSIRGSASRKYRSYSSLVKL
jgi:hypothetical protein